MKNSLRPRKLIWVKQPETSGITHVGYLEGDVKKMSNAWCFFGIRDVYTKALIFCESNHKSYIGKELTFNKAQKLAVKALEKVQKQILNKYWI